MFLRSVYIHMFNLYQAGSITKAVINDQQLHLCKLAFWFCILENQTYRRVSPISTSNTITEKNC